MSGFPSVPMRSSVYSSIVSLVRPSSNKVADEEAPPPCSEGGSSSSFPQHSAEGDVFPQPPSEGDALIDVLSGAEMLPPPVYVAIEAGSPPAQSSPIENGGEREPSRCQRVALRANAQWLRIVSPVSIITLVSSYLAQNHQDYGLAAGILLAAHLPCLFYTLCHVGRDEFLLWDAISQYAIAASAVGSHLLRLDPNDANSVSAKILLSIAAAFIMLPGIVGQNIAGMRRIGVFYLLIEGMLDMPYMVAAFMSAYAHPEHETAEALKALASWTVVFAVLRYVVSVCFEVATQKPSSQQ